MDAFISEPIDRLRVATALIAIKHKPPSQSLSSYVLDLQAAFNDRRPAADTFLDSQSHMVQENTQWTSSVPGGEADHYRLTWRAHALHLESETTWLKAQLEAERVKNATLSVTAKAGQPLSLPEESGNGARTTAGLNPLEPQPQPSSSDVGTSKDSGSGNAGVGGTGKKKSRKNVKQPLPQPQPQSTVGPSNLVPLSQSQLLACINLLSMDDYTSTPSYSHIGPQSKSLSPLVAIDQLFQLAEWISSSNTRHDMTTQAGGQDGGPKEHQNLDLLAASVAVSIDAISLELGSVIRQTSSVSWTAKSLKVFDVYAVVLQSVVTSIFPLFEDPLARQQFSANSKSPRETDALGPNRYSKHLDCCLNCLSQRVLLPCIRSLVPLSIRHLQSIRKGSAKDPRPHVLSLLRKVSAALFSPSKTQSDEAADVALVDALRMSLVLDTLTELNRTLFPGNAVCTHSDAGSRTPSNESGLVDPLNAIWDISGLLNSAQPTSIPPASEKMSVDGPATSPPSLSAQAKRTLKCCYLAKKDGVWFLCAVLHLLSAHPSLPSGTPSSSLPCRTSELSSSTPPSSSFTPSASVPAPLDPTSTQARTTGRSTASLNVTREHMKKAVVDGVLGLLSRCGKVSIGSTTNWKPHGWMDRNSSSNVADRLTGLGPETAPAKVAETSASLSQANTAKALVPEGLSAVRTTEAKLAGGARRQGGGKGCGSWGVDEAEYAMILAAAERVLLAHT